jgi:CheY-like chemotaxis protein
MDSRVVAPGTRILSKSAEGLTVVTHYSLRVPQAQGVVGDLLGAGDWAGCVRSVRVGGNRRCGMRPKKRILYVDDNECDSSLLKFVLVTHHYKVILCSSSQDAIAVVSSTPVDLVLAKVFMGVIDMGGIILATSLKKLSPYTPVLLLDNTDKSIPSFTCADAVVTKKYCSSFELLERIKVLTARKRGRDRALKIKYLTARRSLSIHLAQG